MDSALAPQRGTDPPADRNAVRTSEHVSFAALCSMLTRMKDGQAVGERQVKKKGDKRKEWLKFFRTRFLPEKPSVDLWYDVYRLIIPKLDKERQVYKLKEASLAEVIALSLGIQKSNDAYAQLVHWRKLHGGIFADVVQQVVKDLKLPQPEPDKRPTVKEVNDMLDRLAGVMQRDAVVKQREYQANIMRPLLLNMDSSEIAWLCRIILKLEMKLGMQEKSLLDELHEDANMVFNTCCDLRKTFEVVAPCYPNQRVKRQDVTPGSMISPMGASRVLSLNKLPGTLRSKEYIAELKLDGERIQLHRNGDKISYFTRRWNDFGPRGYCHFDPVVKQQVRSKTCILDGELVVWHTGLKQFVPFGNNKTIFNKVRDAWISTGACAAADSTDDHLEHGGPMTNDEMSQLQVWFMAFDILYDGDHSVIDRPLRERHEILRRAISEPPNGQAVEMTPPGAEEPVFGVIKLLVPGSPWSQPLLASDPKHLDKLMEGCVERDEEGVVFKDLDSQWQKADRSSAWIKFKPDYRTTEDLDLLIIGGFNGTGKRGGKMSMFLMGVAEKPHGGGDPCVFHSFCRVGTGLTMEDLEFLQKHLETRMVPGGRGKQPPCYKVTGTLIETPDFWVKDPRESIVLTVKGDMRPIHTSTFFSKDTLRFPRVTAVRKDKRWSEVCSDMDLKDQMWKTGGLSNGASGGYADGLRGRGRLGADAQQKAKATKRGARTVVAGLAAPSTEGVEQQSDLFAKEQIFVMFPCDEEEPHSMAAVNAVRAFVVAHGGTSVLAWSEHVTRVVTMVFDDQRWPHHANPSALVDVLHVSWLYDCVAEGRVLPPAPRHRLRYVALSEANLERDLDRFGDSYVDPVTPEDVVALLAQASGAAKFAAARADAFAAHVKRPANARLPGTLEAAILEEVRAELQETDVAAMLAEERTLSDTAFSCMRTCHVTLLLLPAPRASRHARQADGVAAAADDAVRSHAFQRLMRGIRLYGGVASEELSEETTHLVALPHAGWASVAPGSALLQHPPPTLADVEAELERRSPAQAALLRKRTRPLANSRDSGAGPGQLWVVSRAWLDNRLACADAGAAPPEAGSAAAPQVGYLHDFVLPRTAAPLPAKRSAEDAGL